MQMLGLNGLITIAKYWREWKDPRLIIVVLNNRDYLLHYKPCRLDEGSSIKRGRPPKRTPEKGEATRRGCWRNAPLRAYGYTATNLTAG
jgi:hypothetical protein